MQVIYYKFFMAFQDICQYY